MRWLTFLLVTNWFKGENYEQEIQNTGDRRNDPQTARRLALGKRLDPWLAFPQTMCCYSFGEKRVPLPIGALRILWKKYPDFKTTCPECGALCYGVAFGGLLVEGDFPRLHRL
jgi:hypothetical protein